MQINEVIFVSCVLATVLPALWLRLSLGTLCSLLVGEVQRSRRELINATNDRKMHTNAFRATCEIAVQETAQLADLDISNSELLAFYAAQIEDDKQRILRAAALEAKARAEQSAAEKLLQHVRWNWFRLAA